jgi:hypothetical protein
MRLLTIDVTDASVEDLRAVLAELERIEPTIAELCERGWRARTTVMHEVVEAVGGRDLGDFAEEIDRLVGESALWKAASKIMGQLAYMLEHPAEGECTVPSWHPKARVTPEQ